MDRVVPEARSGSSAGAWRWTWKGTLGYWDRGWSTWERVEEPESGWHTWERGLGTWKELWSTSERALRTGMEYSGGVGEYVRVGVGLGYEGDGSTSVGAGVPVKRAWYKRCGANRKSAVSAAGRWEKMVTVTVKQTGRETVAVGRN